MGLFKTKIQPAIISSNNIHSLMGSKKGIEVHPDKMVLVDKITPILSKTIDFKYLKEICTTKATKSQPGSMTFIYNFGMPDNFYFEYIQNNNIEMLESIAVEKFEAYKADQVRIENEQIAIANQQEEDRLKQIEDQKLNNPQEYQRKVLLCETIFQEYKDLFKDLSATDLEIFDKVEILKECYRKLEVIKTTHDYNDCFRNIDEEFERVEKKAKSVISAYIKEEREEGNDSCMIDITQFVDDLDFISDWIYEKDENLNKY